MICKMYCCFFSDIASPVKCTFLYQHPAAALLQVSMITRWKILYVSDHFGGIHFTSAQEKGGWRRGGGLERGGWNKNIPIWNENPYGEKQETEPQMASPISFSLGVLQGRLATPPRARSQINTRNQAITLLWKCYVHNRYVIIFHLLAVFNSLIIISLHWTGRKLFPSWLGVSLSLTFSFFGGAVWDWFLIYMAVVVVVRRCIFMWVLFGVLQDCL